MAGHKKVWKQATPTQIRGRTMAGVIRAAGIRLADASTQRPSPAVPSPSHYQLKPVGQVICLGNQGHLKLLTMGRSPDAVAIRTNDFNGDQISVEVQKVKEWICTAGNTEACKFQVAKPSKSSDADRLREKIRASDSEIGNDLVAAIDDVSRMSVRGKDEINGEQTVNVVFFMLADLYLAKHITADPILALHMAFKRENLSAQETVNYANALCGINKIPLSFHVGPKENAFHGICYGKSL